MRLKAVAVVSVGAIAKVVPLDALAIHATPLRSQVSPAGAQAESAFWSVIARAEAG
jgi:hypothetical protein